MKVLIKLEYRDKVYSSDDMEVNKERRNEIIDEITVLTKKISEDRPANLSLEKGNKTYFFGKKVLEESILTVCVYK